MSSTITCAICGFICKGLTLHLIHRHDMKPAEYREKYPNAEIFSKAVKQQMSENSHMKNNNQTFEERFGDRADEIKKKVGETSGAARLGKKRPKQAETIKITWEEKRDEWSKAIADSFTPERRQACSRATKKRIEENGYHLARGRETKLEKLIREILQTAGYEVIKQRGTKKGTLSTIRFYDLYVPSLNLLIECDGEYWHCRDDRIKIDLEKDYAAKIEGYKLLRISDKEIRKKNDNLQFVLKLLDLSDEELTERSARLIQERRIKLDSKC